MNRRQFSVLGLIGGLAAAGFMPLSAGAQPLPDAIRMVIGSNAVSGDTYQNASIIAEALSAHLGIKVKVDAVGISEAFKAVGRDPRGTTVMFHHDQSYLSHLYGVRGFSDIFSAYKVGPVVSVNPGNAYLVPKQSPYQSVDDLLKAAADGTRVRVGIQAGGVSEIGFSALKNAARLAKPGSEANIVAVNSGSQADKNQQLFDGQVEVINGSVQANEQFTRLPDDDQKAMRFLWLTASREIIEEAPEAGFGQTSREQLLQYVTPAMRVTLDGQQDFVFDKDFFLLYNKDMPDEMVKAIDEALAAIYAKGDVQKTLKSSFFIPHFLPSQEAAAYLKTKDGNYRQVIEAIAAKN